LRKVVVIFIAIFIISLGFINPLFTNIDTLVNLKNGSKISVDDHIIKMEQDPNKTYDSLIETRTAQKKINQIGINMHFTANYDQVGCDDVKYYIQGQGVWFTNSGIVFELIEPAEAQPSIFDKFEIPPNINNFKNTGDEIRKSSIVRFEFANSNKVNPIGLRELPHKSNFFYGNDSSKWRANVPNYEELIYENIYDGIDLRYYFNENGLKYDFIIYPGGDHEDIMISINGAEDLFMDSNGDVRIKTESDYIMDKNLLVYQDHKDGILQVKSSFKLIDNNIYGFDISNDYDKTKILFIDPLIYSTFIGGKNEDSCYDIQIDEDGNVYLTGHTDSPNFPVIDGSNDTTLNGMEDIFVLKLNNNGTSLFYSTFIGGENNDFGYGIAIDMNGSAYITGFTQSGDYPTTPDAYDDFNGLNDVIVFKLSPNGDFLDFSTCIGSWGNEYAFDLVLDYKNNIYITGFADFLYPISPGVYQSNFFSGENVIVTILNATGTGLLHSTVIGTTESSKKSRGTSIALDRDKNIYISGYANSPSFPTTKGAYRETYSHGGFEGIVFKLNSNMTKLLYSTFIGITNMGYVDYYGIPNVIIDREDNIYITTTTSDNNYPTTPDAYDKSFNGFADVLILKLNTNLSTLLYATYIGGEGEDAAYGSVLDKDNNVYVVGYTNSSNFPMLDGVYDQGYNGNKDVFIIKLNITDSELRYSSFIGGNKHDRGYGIEIDDEGYIYIGGAAEQGFPTTPGSYCPSFNGGVFDAFTLKLKLLSNPIIKNLNISEEVMYRSHTIEVNSNAFDNEDLERHLTPHFEYREVDDPLNWSTTKLSPPVYVNEQWQTTFSIPINASLGYYDFRVRFNDTDDMWTPWLYLNDSLQVLNNLPQIDYFNLSKNNVITGEDFSLLVNGTDVEDDLQKLSFEPEYKYSMDNFWDPVDFYEMGFMGTKFEFNFSMSADMEYGYYDFRVRTIDCDNGTSPWSYLNKSLLVNSAPPIMISIHVSKPEVYRTQTLEIYVNCTDFDSPRDELTIELQYMPVAEGNWFNLSPEDMVNFWIDDLRTKNTSDLGIYNFRARATDWEDNSCRWFYLNDSLQVLNNLPRLMDISNIPEKMNRKSSRTIFINGSDKEDNENALYVELEYKLPGTQVWIVDYLSVPYYFDDCWCYEFSLPKDAPNGKYSFRARVQDLDKDWSTYLYLNDSLLVENQIPIVISFDQSPKEVYRTETVIVTSAGSDLETSSEKLECNMYYKSPDDVDWEKLEVNYNDTSKKWDSELITTISSTLGNYSFKVEFKDSYGIYSKPVYANRSVWVRNNLPVISDELDDIKVGSTQTILKLTDYGYDVETPKSNLKWMFDFSTVDTTLFHIDDENLDEQELIIYPAKSKEGRDDITLILVDSDNGKAVRTDVTIVVNSKTGGKDQLPGQSNPIESMVGTSNIWLYILILVIIIIFIILLIYYRRKKQKEQIQKEEAEREAEETPVSEPVQDLPVVVDEAKSTLESPTPEPAPVIEEPEEPVPVPMPAEAPRQELPPPTPQSVTEPPPTVEEPQTQPAEVEPQATSEPIEENTKDTGKNITNSDN
jgi:hypothetical protein